MPIPFLVNTAKETGKDIKDLEKSWKKAQKIVKKEYKKITSTNPHYYALVTSIFKNLESLNEGIETYIPIKEFNKYYTGMEIEDKEGGIVTLIKDPSRTDLLKVCRMAFPEKYGRGGISNSVLYVWPGVVLHNDVEKKLEIHFDSKFEFRCNSGSITVSPSMGSDSDEYIWVEFMEKHPAIVKRLMAAGIDGFMSQLENDPENPIEIPLSDLLDPDELTEDGEVAVVGNTTASVFTDANGNDTRYKTPVLNTISRGSKLPKPKVKRPSGYSRMIPSLHKSLTEGGNVFTGKTDKIKKEFITPTLDSYFKELKILFPKKKDLFNTEHFTPVGSVGKKPYSGDIDLAIDLSVIAGHDGFNEKTFEDWGIDQSLFDPMFEKLKKKARTATESDLKTRAFLYLLADKINKSSKNIYINEDKITNGNIFTLYPQYDESGNKRDIGVQIDWMIGNKKWLQFSYHSNSYAGNVKGLHRTQLMLSMFTNLGLTFNHVNGVKNKNTGEILATSPEEAVELLNYRYNLNGKLTQEILSDYFKLMEFIRANLSKEDYDGIIDIYLKILDSTKADIPEDLQDEWKLRKDRLKLTGKFLPADSKLLTESFNMKSSLFEFVNFERKINIL